MAKKKKSATDLLDNPLVDETPFEEEPEQTTPFDKTHRSLTATGGKMLELMTRTTPQLAAAISTSSNYLFNFKSRYIQDRSDRLMRLHVSVNGQGRSEMVQALQSGAGVPGEFYADDNPMSSIGPALGDGDDPDE